VHSVLLVTHPDSQPEASNITQARPTPGMALSFITHNLLPAP